MDDYTAANLGHKVGITIDDAKASRYPNVLSEASRSTQDIGAGCLHSCSNEQSRGSDRNMQGIDLRAPMYLGEASLSTSTDGGARERTMRRTDIHQAVMPIRCLSFVCVCVTELFITILKHIQTTEERTVQVHALRPLVALRCGFSLLSRNW